MDFYSLKVVDVRPETTEAVSLFLEVPEGQKDVFKYQSGQYLTLRFTLGGEELRRAYSMCSSPLEAQLAVTVKRVPDGRVSTHINKNVRKGDMIEVSAPEGRFVPKLDPDQRKDYYFFAAGSGITPVYSMIKTILEEEPQSTVFLLYGNRNEEQIIFKKGLENLLERYEGQLVVEHCLSQPIKKKASGIGGLFKKGVALWQGWTGRIDSGKVRKFVEGNPSRGTGTAEYFLCGPGGMIEAAKSSLQSMGADDRNVHVEYFSTPETTTEKQGTAAKTPSGKATAKVELNGQWVEVEVAPGKTILDALIDAKYDPPYSCTSGSCSTCMAKMQEGEASMEVCYALDDDEVEEGYILTCQAHPKTNEVKLTFDV